MVGVWEQINMHLLAAVRARDGRHASSSAAVIDSLSAKTTEKGGPRGYGSSSPTARRSWPGARGTFSSTRGACECVSWYTRRTWPTATAPGGLRPPVLDGARRRFGRLERVWADQG